MLVPEEIVKAWYKPDSIMYKNFMFEDKRDK